MPRLFKNLTFQVLTAIAAGIVVGHFFPETAKGLRWLGESFINLIKMVIAPVIFLTIVLGIGSMGDVKRVGRVGGRAILYFEIVTTLALLIGIGVAYLIRPGDGLDTSHLQKGDISSYTAASHDFDWAGFFLHIVPGNVVRAFAEGDILQVLVFSVLFGVALSRLGDDARPVIKALERLSKIFFGILRIVMVLAPLGALGGMAYTVGTYGLASLLPLGKLMLTVYMTMALFIFVILNAIMHYCRVSLWRFLGFVREELLIVLGTSSSEAALPALMDKLERMGCEKSIVGLVVPAGYSFNLDGTTIYLSMAVIFLAQVFQVHLTLAQMGTIIGILMVTSKGAAGVTGSGFIVLASTLAAVRVIPVEGMALLLGVDRFMSEARSITNFIGNGVATVFISVQEKAFSYTKMQRAFARGGDSDLTDSDD